MDKNQMEILDKSTKGAKSVVAVLLTGAGPAFLGTVTDGGIGIERSIDAVYDADTEIVLKTLEYLSNKLQSEDVFHSAVVMPKEDLKSSSLTIFKLDSDAEKFSYAMLIISLAMEAGGIKSPDKKADMMASLATGPQKELDKFFKLLHMAPEFQEAVMKTNAAIIASSRAEREKADKDKANG